MTLIDDYKAISEIDGAAIDLIPRDVSATYDSIIVIGENIASTSAKFMVFSQPETTYDILYKDESLTLTSNIYIYGGAIEVDNSGIYTAFNFEGTVTGTGKNEHGKVVKINVTSKGTGANTLLIKFNTDYTIINYCVIGDGTNFFTTSRIRKGNDGTIWLSGAMNSGTANMGNETITTLGNKSIWAANYPAEV
jgi:hypothetical protein